MTVISTLYPALLGVHQMIPQKSLSSLNSSTWIQLLSQTASIKDLHPLRAAVKLGIGLGIPVAVLVVMVLSFVLYRIQ